MNIALVFPPFYFEPMYNLPPLGLINLATVLRSSPHSVRIFDFPLAIRRKALSMDSDIYRECARQILQFEPDLAAFSVQCTTYPPAVRIAEELKKLNPALKIVFGGHNASFVDELTLSRFPFIDAIVRGEGEITFPELIRAFEGQIPLASIDGITFRTSDQIIRNPDRELIENLDSLPRKRLYVRTPPSCIPGRLRHQALDCHPGGRPGMSAPVCLLLAIDHVETKDAHIFNRPDHWGNEKPGRKFRGRVLPARL